MKKFCYYQMKYKEDMGKGTLSCIAHIDEGRCFECPYESYEDSQNRKYPCVDAKIERERFLEEENKIENKFDILDMSE